jgi:outer membrane receptor protein involved in Fe transport
MKVAVNLILNIIYAIGSVYGAEAPVAPDSIQYRFNPIIVTATKFEGAQKDLPASVSVLDQEIIQSASTSSVLELVSDHVPGVFFTERGVFGYGTATGAAGGISIRGVGGSPTTDVLVLRDGRPDIMGMMGHPIPDAYSLDGVERIEIIRGPASFLYGTNAMGGVINIVSKKMINDGFKTRLTGGMGSFNTQKLTATHGGKLGAFDYYVTAGVKKTDGHRDFSEYEGDFYTAHAGYRLDKYTSLEFNGNLSNLSLFDPGTETNPFKDHWYDMRRSGADLTLDNTNSLGETTVKLHGNFGRHKIYDGWRSNDHTYGIMFYHNLKPWSGNTSTLGFDIKNYGGDAMSSFGKVPFIDYTKHDILEYAPYVHLQQVFLRRFIASAGVRVEHHQLYGTEVLPKVGLVTHFFNNTSLRLSAAKGFRSPSIRELYIFPPRNKTLKPEEMWNLEIGLGQDIAGRIKLDAALFRSEGDNMILLKLPDMYYFNSGKFTHSGYELSLQYFPMATLELSASWSKLDLQDETLNSPGKKLTVYAGYSLKNVKISGNLVHIRDLFGDINRALPMKNYTVVNVNIDVTPLHDIGLGFSLKNATNETYQTMYGYPMPGRMFTADLSLSY